MKKSIGILCCVLLLGVICLFHTEGEVPLHWFQPLLRMKVSKAVIKDRSLILFNVKIVRQRFEFVCPKLQLGFKKNNFLCHINQATLKYGPYVFSHISGVIKKQRGFYKAFITLDNRYISNIQVMCDSFSPKTFQALTEVVDSFNNAGQSFSGRDFKLHISQNNVHIQLADLTFDHMHMMHGYGKGYIDGARLKYLQKTDLVRYQNLNLAPVCCNGIINLKNFAAQQLFAQAKTTHESLGLITVALGARDVSLGGRMPAYIQWQSDALDADGNFEDLKKWELDKGFVKCTSENFLKKWEALQPYNLSLQHPLYLKLHGNFQHLSGVLDTKQVVLTSTQFRHIHSTFKIENREKFSWDGCLHADKMHPRVSGFYDLLQDYGEIHCAGRISPEFTYAFKLYLPDWWEPFFKQFHFNKTYPYTNFSLFFKTQEPWSFCFGYASAKQVHFKQSNLQQFYMNFGNCPGYCWLRINDLKMNRKHGACEIHWPYDMENPQQERWIFNGNGNFKASDWLHLLEDFIGKSEKFEMLKRFQPKAETQSKFEGFISSIPNDKDRLAVKLKMPKGKIWDFPVRDFSADYVWNPSITQIKNLHANLLGKSPVIADISWQQEHLNFHFKGQGIATKPLFNHPWFQPWTNVIPKDNLETYDGVLDLDLKGQGTCLKELRVSGNGHLEFQNPNLSQVHILGPLTRLFSKKFKWLPMVSFNKLISDFSFTEQKISTQNSTLLGPSTRADLQGNIDLSQQKIQGEIHFSFLDYKQLNLPIMKHFVQIFQPISKGFSVKISGTFSEPHWSPFFNPFRFVLPKK